MGNHPTVPRHGPDRPVDRGAGRHPSPPAHARKFVAALLGGDPPVTIVPGAATFGLLDSFADALRLAAGI